ncbi:MAG TPA: hypothetical protein ENJ11_07405 [Gammaproteobacteria bacterium]|nr:hypothetical protein [Gammaproteobacteria bacterium]
MTTPLTKTRQWLAVLASAIPYLYLSWVLLDVWRFPMQWDNGRWVPFAVGLLVLEFILLHSGVFIATLAAESRDTKKQIKIFLGLLLFYGLMTYGIARSTGSNELMLIFASVMLGRFISSVLLREGGRDEYMKRAALGIVLYLLLTAASIFLPVPELGITSSVLAEVYPDRGGGIWEREPERAIAMACIYFCLLGLAELFVFGPAENKGTAQNRTYDQAQ